jgi:hypothetical protein
MSAGDLLFEISMDEVIHQNALIDIWDLAKGIPSGLISRSMTNRLMTCADTHWKTAHCQLQEGRDLTRQGNYRQTIIEGLASLIRF